MSRKEKSLGLLCHRFLARFPDCPETAAANDICLDDMATELSRPHSHFLLPTPIFFIFPPVYRFHFSYGFHVSVVIYLKLVTVPKIYIHIHILSCVVPVKCL